MRYAVLLLVVMLAACAVNEKTKAEEEYLVSVYDTKGRLLSRRIELGGNKASIPLVRDTLCKVHPYGIIRVHNKYTKTLAKEYQPYSCSNSAEGSLTHRKAK